MWLRLWLSARLSYSWNAGVDLALFHNRIELILDAYYKRTDNMLVIAPLPSYASSIIGAPWVNVGAMQNKGFEITLNTVNVSKKDLTWKSGLTFSLNRNKVTDLYTATSGLQGNIDNVTYTYTQVGCPVGQFYGYKVKGMFSNEDDFYLKDKNGDYLLDANGNRKFVALPTGMSVKEGEVWYGDYIWEDLNGDGVIDEKDRTNIGNPLPKFTFGLNNSVTWKNFDLNVFISGSVGNKVYNYLDQETANPINWSGAMRKVQHYACVEKIDPNGERTIGNMHFRMQTMPTSLSATLSSMGALIRGVRFSQLTNNCSNMSMQTRFGATPLSLLLARFTRISTSLAVVIPTKVRMLATRKGQ